MSNDEFDVIEKYFTFKQNRNDVTLAGGDDCAIVSVPTGKQLLVTTDTLIQDVHFPESTTPEDIAYKAIMVNLSDLAAMGAAPAWLTLAITLPEINEDWLRMFSKQFESVLSKFNICLIGGDTTKGSLSITIQAMGFSDTGKIMRRDSAKPGDKVFVTGTLGDAAIGLKAMLNNIEDKTLQPCIDRLNRPEARIKFAEELSEYSTCAIDISDGLVSDFGHIAKASRCGANINLSDIPLSSTALYYIKHYLNNQIDWSLLLAQGDDYELCFTANKNNQKLIETLAIKHQLKVSCIGEVTTANVVAYSFNKKEVIFSKDGFKHF